MKVLLIKPPYTRLRGVGQAPYFPLGLGYIAAVLRANGHEAMIYHVENPRLPEDSMLIDAELTFNSRSQSEKRYHEAVRNEGYYVWREVRETLDTFRPDLVGITMLSVEVASALRVSKICKQHNPDLPVVWGGVHPTFLYAESLRYPEVDFVVRGEGEQAMLELCHVLEGKGGTPAGVKGLSFRQNGAVVNNPDRPPIANIDEIPFPARDAGLYPGAFDFKSLGSMIISRGCPFRCTFCSSRNFWDKVCRFRSPENVIAEIRLLKERYGTRHIMFWDDTLTINRKTIEKYCGALIEANLKVNWKGSTRADLVDEAFIDLLKKAGCVKLEIGVESGSDRMKKLIHKDVTNEQIQRAFRLTNGRGIGSGAFFMAGFPEETVEDLDQTWQLMKELDATEMAFNIFDPMPGSDEYVKCQQMGLVPADPDWSCFPFWPDAHYVRDISPEEFSRRANEIAEWLYHRNNSLRYKFRRNGQYIQSLIFSDPLHLAAKTWRFLVRRWKVRRIHKGIREGRP